MEILIINLVIVFVIYPLIIFGLVLNYKEDKKRSKEDKKKEQFLKELERLGKKNE